MIHPTELLTLPYEQAIYAQLKGVQGIPRIRWSGQDANAIVMDKLGPDLEKFRLFWRGSFSLQRVVLLGERMVSYYAIIDAYTDVVWVRTLEESIQTRKCKVGLGIRLVESGGR